MTNIPLEIDKITDQWELIDNNVTIVAGSVIGVGLKLGKIHL